MFADGESKSYLLTQGGVSSYPGQRANRSAPIMKQDAYQEFRAKLVADLSALDRKREELDRRRAEVQTKIETVDAMLAFAASKNDANAHAATHARIATSAESAMSVGSAMARVVWHQVVAQAVRELPNRFTTLEVRRGIEKYLGRELDRNEAATVSGTLKKYAERNSIEVQVGTGGAPSTFTKPSNAGMATG